MSPRSYSIAANKLARGLSLGATMCICHDGASIFDRKNLLGRGGAAVTRLLGKAVVDTVALTPGTFMCEAVPIRGSPNGARHPYPQVVAIAPSRGLFQQIP